VHIPVQRVHQRVQITPLDPPLAAGGTRSTCPVAVAALARFQAPVVWDRTEVVPWVDRRGVRASATRRAGIPSGNAEPPAEGTG
jgi:hypothetical protein